MKYYLSRKIMTEFVALRLKAYSCLTDNNDEDKKSKATKMCVIIPKLKLKHCLKATPQLEYKINHLEKTELMWLFLEKIIKNSSKTIN